MFECFYPYEYADSVFQIDYKSLYDLGFRGIIFDVDNTLVHHGEEATCEVESLFRQIQQIGFQTILLSDNDAERLERFVTNIDTQYICDAGKPNPAGYIKAVRMLKTKKSETVVIGDQIFKDIWGANKSGLASILVKFIKGENETKIGKRRYLEYLILNAWKYNKTYYKRLGNIFTEEENTDEEKVIL